MAVSAASTTLKINKVWKNDAATSHDPITVKIVTKEDDQDNDYLTGTIGASGNWEADMAVAPGLKADVDGNGTAELLNKGHTYKLSEPSLDTTHYTVSYSDDGFKTGFKPMIVNGQLEGLPNNSASLTITNTRKEIKTGVKNTDNTAPMVGAGLALAALAAVFVFKRKLGR
jgi:LPXTG-motif cell wall-anchored protein